MVNLSLTPHSSVILKRLRNRRTEIKVFVLVAAFIGFVTQVTQVSLQYFAYTTYVQVQVTVPDHSGGHGIGVCFRYVDILNYEQLAKETHIRLNKPKNATDVSIEGKLTIAQIFKFTPAENETIDRCWTRLRWSLNEMTDKKLCLSRFAVQKFVTQEYICYVFREVRNESLTMRSVTRSRQFQSTIWAVSLTKAFADVFSVRITTFANEQLPFVSMDFSVNRLLKKAFEHLKQVINSFDVFPSDFVVTRMPPPFETMCRDENSTDRWTCKFDCIAHHFNGTDLMMSNDIIPIPMDSKLIGSEDEKNESLLSFAEGVTQRCEDACFFIPCHVMYSKTSVNSLYLAHEAMVLEAMTSVEPTLGSNAIASMTFVDFFSFLCGCFGIWFGVSFLSIDPFKNEPLFPRRLGVDCHHSLERSVCVSRRRPTRNVWLRNY